MYYFTDTADRALALTYLPQPAGGSPLIVTSDIYVRFAYAVAADSSPPTDSRASRDPSNTLVEVVADESLLAEHSTADLYAVCESGICPGYISRYYYGSTPMSRHPLADRGMAACGVFEVRPSAWLRHLQHTEPEQFPTEIYDRATGKKLTYHHVLFTFRDSTLEFITDRLLYELVSGADGARHVLQGIKWGEDIF